MTRSLPKWIEPLCLSTCIHSNVTGCFRLQMNVVWKMKMNWTEGVRTWKSLLGALVFLLFKLTHLRKASWIFQIRQRLTGSAGVSHNCFYYTSKPECAIPDDNDQQDILHVLIKLNSSLWGVRRVVPQRQWTLTYPTEIMRYTSHKWEDHWNRVTYHLNVWSITPTLCPPYMSHRWEHHWNFPTCGGMPTPSNVIGCNGLIFSLPHSTHISHDLPQS